MTRPGSLELMNRALAARTVIPAFNIPYLPMVEPVIAALRDGNCFGFVAVARLEFVKFEARSMRAVIRDDLEIENSAPVINPGALSQHETQTQTAIP